MTNLKGKKNEHSRTSYVMSDKPIHHPGKNAKGKTDKNWDPPLKVISTASGLWICITDRLY